MPLARDYGWEPGTLKPGPQNSITDVAGVAVGHSTLFLDELRTGVTAIIPHKGNLYRQKVAAAAHVINGFGKSIGLMQVQELGNIETPILLTNTLSVSACSQALIRRAIADNPDIGRETSTVNPLVCECNDGFLSDIQQMAVEETHAFEALENAVPAHVEQGSVGAGTGMCCFGFKGGIGTASRQMTFGDSDFYLGALVLSNFGKPGDLTLPDGRRVSPASSIKSSADKGSVIVIVATDAPLDSRQLHRVSRRCGAGLARLGSFWGNGSGDIVIGFSTSQPINHDETRAFTSREQLNENIIDTFFQAACEATQEAVLNSMLMSPGMTGRAGHSVPSLADALSL